MKITVIGPTFPYKGGISHYNTVFCQNLIKTHKIDAISFKRQYPKLLFPGKDQRDKKSKDRIKFKATELIDTINPFTWLKTVKRIQEFCPEIVLLYWWTPYFTFNFFTISYLVKKLTRSKVVFLCHNVAPHEARFVDKFLTKIGLSYADSFIVHGEEEKETLKSMVPKAKITKHVHPTYDIFKEKFKKENINLKLRKKVILFFGYVRKYKGLDHLLDALPELVKKYPDLDLLIVGEFWKDSDDTLEKIKNHPEKDHIKLVDSYVPNEKVGNYFEVCDICVLPYNSATNSGIVQTAFAFEKPCIVTRVGALPEVVLHDKTGLVIDRKSPKAIIEAVSHFYDKNKAKDYKQNIIKEKDRFSWDRLVEVLEKQNEA
tara:strand:+ start:709 stop:1827 length:1119 start_codon:yes stop_codon:yes gene_type:complete